MILRKLSIWVSFCVSNLPGCLKLHRLELPLVKLGFQCVHAGSVKQTLHICMETPFLEQRWFAGPWSKLFAFVFVWFSQDMNIYSVGEKSFFFFFFKLVEIVLPLWYWWYSLILRTKSSCLISTFLLMRLGFNFIAPWWWQSQMCEYKL